MFHTHDIYIYVCSYVCVRACTYMYRSYLCRFRRRSPTYTYTLGAQSGPAFRPSSATTEERCVPTREKWVQPTDTVEGRARGGREGRKVGGMGGKDATCFCPMRCAEHDCVSLYWTNLGLLGGTRCSNPLFLPSSPSYLPSSFFSFLLTYVFPFYCRSINRFYFIPLEPYLSFFCSFGYSCASSLVYTWKPWSLWLFFCIQQKAYFKEIYGLHMPDI